MVVKTKAHVTLADAKEGTTTTMWEYLGNRAADHRARQGAELHPWSADADDSLERAWTSALEVAGWAAWQEASAGCLPLDTLEDIEPEERAQRRDAAAKRRQQAGTLEVLREESSDATASRARRLAAALS